MEDHIIGSSPVIGPVVQRILIGGDEIGHLTLTHLYFLHVALLPLLVGLLLAVHLGQIYRHGLFSSDTNGTKSSSTPYWPYQSIRNLTVFALVFGAVALAAWLHGAPLEFPADPQFASAHTPRPEWYFRSLFHLRNMDLFKGPFEIVATMVIPTVALVLLLAMPFIDRAFSRPAAMMLRYVVVVGGVAFWGWFTLASVMKDVKDDDYQAKKRAGIRLASRARLLADAASIPPEDAIALLRNDPLTQGRLLFERHCASCHSHLDSAGEGIESSEPSAPNLYGFADRRWIARMFDADVIASEEFFAHTAHAEGEMVDFVQNDLAEWEEQEIDQTVKALSAEAAIPAQRNADQEDSDDIDAGRELLADEDRCASCHKFGEVGELGSAPDLTGYGSLAWLVEMISDPEGERFYPDSNDRMPAFVADPEHPEKNLLTAGEILLVARFLLGDYLKRVPDAQSNGQREAESVAAGR